MKRAHTQQYNFLPIIFNTLKYYVCITADSLNINKEILKIEIIIIRLYKMKNNLRNIIENNISNESSQIRKNDFIPIIVVNDFFYIA